MITRLALTLAFFFSAVAYSQDDLSEVAKALYGGDIHSPSPKSLIGKYIARTGAKTVVRRFLTAPKGSELPVSTLGPEKLVVAVSAETLSQFSKIASDKHFLFQYHYPHAQHFYFGFESKVYNFYGRAGIESLDDWFVSPKPNVPRDMKLYGSMFLPILLSTAEANRTQDFIDLFMVRENPWDGIWIQPWNLDNGSQSPEMYAPKDGYYLGCAHWFGNMPIGSKTVSEYVFSSGPSDPKGERPNTKSLTEYSRFRGQAIPGSLDSLVRKVWTVPGHETLADLLGQRAANLRGEFANPGWIAYTLTGSVGIDRVPVVFLYVEDATKPIDSEFDTFILAI